jgi:hypothetical protein
MFAIQGSMIERRLMTGFAGDMLLDGLAGRGSRITRVLKNETKAAASDDELNYV